MIDLGMWLTEQYRIPAPEDEPVAERQDDMDGNAG
jgi:endogenous inhibitor of DNA gyrase (YacG/DUF329 family)